MGMPEAIRATVESVEAHPPRGGFCAARIMLAALAAISSTAAVAAEGPPGSDVAAGPDTFAAYLAAFQALDRHELAAMALTLGILCFAVVTAILLVRTRARLADTEVAARDESIAAKAAVDRAYALLLAEPQILVAWAAGSDHPEIIGDPALIAAPGEPQRILAFGSWLRPDRAAEMERSVDALRARGQSFELTVTTLNGRTVEADGQVIGGRAILRLREVTGVKYELAELAQRHRRQTDDMAALQALIDAMPSPVWARDEAGKLNFVNAAYVHAVEAKSGIDAVERGIELFGGAAGSEILRAHEAATAYGGRLPAVIAGHRRTLDVISVPAPRGSAGIGGSAIGSTAGEAFPTHAPTGGAKCGAAAAQCAGGIHRSSGFFGSSRRTKDYCCR
jgi:PAS domain-containing protein